MNSIGNLKNKSTLDVFTSISEKSNTHSPSVRNIKRMKIGDVIRQGDVYLERIGSVPSTKGKTTKNLQLAVGSTQGSRHIINPVPTGMKIYSPADNASPLIGPVVSSTKRFVLTHPEHGHFSLPGGVYQVRYQRDYAKERAEELRRVQD